MTGSFLKAALAVIGVLMAASEAKNEIKNVRKEYNNRHNSPMK